MLWIIALPCGVACTDRSEVRGNKGDASPTRVVIRAKPRSWSPEIFARITTLLKNSDDKFEVSKQRKYPQNCIKSSLKS